MTRHHLTWRVTAVAAAMLLCLSSAACSAKSSSDYATSGRYYEEIDNGYDGYEDYESTEGMMAEDSSVMENNSGSVKTASKTTDTAQEEIQDKIIRTADVSMESDDAAKCYATLLAFVRENGGSELSMKKTRSDYGNYSYLNIEATLKIAPDKLDEFLKLAEDTDKVLSSSVTSDDVTKEYYDIQLRLKSKKEALKKYYKLLDEATSVQESLEVQRYITDLTAEIESMEGMLRYYDAKVDLSTIYLDIRQTEKLSPDIDDEFHWDSLSFGDVGKLMKNGFLRVVNFLWSLIVWTLIAAVALSPILLIAGVVFLLVRRHIKKKNAARQRVAKP